MLFAGLPRTLVTFSLTIACLAVVVAPSPVSVEDSPTTVQDTSASLTSLSLSSRDTVDEIALAPSAIATTSTVTEVASHAAVKETSLVDANKGHEQTHIKQKKKKPVGKHKKKKHSFKDKLLPLLLIPFVIQTMLIPFFIMKLKFLALKAMTVGKFAILLIIFNMMRNWSKNAHSTSIRSSSGDSLMAQNYGYNGGPEFGSLFSGNL